MTEHTWCAPSAQIDFQPIICNYDVIEAANVLLSSEEVLYLVVFKYRCHLILLMRELKRCRHLPRVFQEEASPGSEHINTTMSLRVQLPSLLSSTRRLALLRSFSSSARRPDFHFDTHHFVQRLEREGLSRAQAEGIMSAMAEVIDESIRNMTSNMVTKAEQEKVRPRRVFSSSKHLYKLADVEL